MKKKKNRAAGEVLVKWIGMLEDEVSWVEYKTLANDFPKLVDKVLRGKKCYVLSCWIVSRELQGLMEL